MKHLHSLLSGLLLAVLAMGLCACGDKNEQEDPYDYTNPLVTSAKVEFTLKVNENFSDYFTIMATHVNTSGQLITDLLKTDEMTIPVTFSSFPASVTIQLQFMRNSKPSPVPGSADQMTFAYTIEETASYTILNEPRETHNTITFNNSLTPSAFENWSATLINTPKSYTITISKNGVVDFKQ